MVMAFSVRSEAPSLVAKYEVSQKGTAFLASPFSRD